MVTDIPKKIFIKKNYISRIKKYEKEINQTLFSLSKDYFSSSDNYVLIRIPTSRIENFTDLDFSVGDRLEEVYKDFPEEVDYISGLNYTLGLKDTNLSRLANFSVKKERKSNIQNIYQKLTKNDCNLKVHNCSIAQGLMLGKNYDHCENCLSNDERLFIQGTLEEVISIVPNGENTFNNPQVKDKDNNSVESFTLMNKKSFDLVSKLLGDLIVDVYIPRGDWYIRNEEVTGPRYSSENVVKNSLKEKIFPTETYFKITDSCKSRRDKDLPIEIYGYFFPK